MNMDPGMKSEKEYGYSDDDRNSCDGDRHSRDSEDRYGRDANREEDYRRMCRGVDNYYHQTIEVGVHIGNERLRMLAIHQGVVLLELMTVLRMGGLYDKGQLQRKFSEQKIGDPPSYEEAVSESRTPLYSERDSGETQQAAATGGAAPGGASPTPPQFVAPAAASPPAENNTDNKSAALVNESSAQKFEPTLCIFSRPSSICNCRRCFSFFNSCFSHL